MACFSTEWGDKRDMRAVCSGTRQVLRGGINNAVSGFVMQRQLAPPLLNRPNHRHGGPRWRDTDLSVFLSFFLPLVFLLFLPLELTRQVNYIWEIRRRNSDEELSTEISEFSPFPFPREKFILYGIQHESDITVFFFPFFFPSKFLESRYVRERYIIRDDYR